MNKKIWASVISFGAIVSLVLALFGFFQTNAWTEDIEHLETEVAQTLEIFQNNLREQTINDRIDYLVDRLNQYQNLLRRDPTNQFYIDEVNRLTNELKDTRDKRDKLRG